MPFDEKGLTSDEAKLALQKFGPNLLPEKRPPSDFEIFFSQLKSPLVYVLLAAGAVTFLLRDYQDAVIILVAVLINTIFGFIQERRANQALASLKKLIHPNARVIRDGLIQTIQAEEVVPGDFVVLSQGDKMAADGVLVHANRLFVNESMLTGESIPVGKKVKDDGFMGTIITSGQGLLRVTHTGEDTQIGKIATSITEVTIYDTPLRRQLSRFSKQLVYLAIILTAGVFILGIITGRGLIEIFTTSVALAVSAIPEGLLVALTVVLALGMQRILARKGLVRNLVSAETLGGVTTICADKTGTLTLGQMRVDQILGDKEKLALQALVANDQDDPMVIAAYDWAKAQFSVETIEDMFKSYKRLDSIPFSSEERYFASLHKDKSANSLYVNGAPDYLLRWTNLIGAQQKKINEQIEHLSQLGFRLVGYAKKTVSSKKTSISASDIKNDLEWVGMLVFADPVRKGVKEALQKTRDAGIKLIIITGDYPKTARAVMAQLGIKVADDQIMLGPEVEQISHERLRAKLKDHGRIILFARTTPNLKLKIIEALKDNNEVVAMMGDGVNDAPALAKADIGIVVGDATDVAKESADLVLLDSSFETIVAAVEEGRSIFDNIRKVILYLLCDGFEEIISVLITLVIGLPLPITAAQILWINIVSDGFPNIALTVDPKRRDIMKQSPRDSRESLVTGWMRSLIVSVSICGAVFATFLFILSYNSTNDLVFARSVAFAALGVNSLVYVFSVRDLQQPFWKANIFRNKWLVISVCLGFVLQLLPFVIPSLQTYFEVTPLPAVWWALIILAAIMMFILIELSKLLLRRRVVYT